MGVRLPPLLFPILTMKKVYYLPTIGANDSFQKEYFPEDYIPAPKKFSSGYDRNYSHAKCPAWKEWGKNIWVFYQPFDLGMIYKSETKYLETNLPQEMFDEFFLQTPNWLDGELPEIQFRYGWCFWTKEKDVWIEQLPHFQICRFGIEPIPGTFPLSVWQRPINFGFKILDHDTNIWIPKGTPLFMVKLYSQRSDSNFLLEKKVPPEDVLEKQSQNLRLKEFDRYASWELIQNRLKKEQEESKCPFKFLWKK